MRRALLVATDTYQANELQALGAPLEDAQALAEALRDPTLGDFGEITLLHNRPAHEVLRALEQWFTSADAADTLLLYVTGHGVRGRDDKSGEQPVHVPGPSRPGWPGRASARGSECSCRCGRKRCPA